ncbi:MAG: cell division protein CrgA [Actinomycetota bacterium]|nr:cell division protein CrgA [Actinomycetota bacterium]
MARRTKDAPGRATPKGTRPNRPAKTANRAATSRSATAGTGTAKYAREATGRYTPPTSQEARRPSPWWVPTIMLAFFGLGVLSIILNYLGVLPSSPSNVYLLAGLGLIIFGFITSTRWH